MLGGCEEHDQELILTFTACVEQSCLERCHWGVMKAFLDGDLHSEAGVWVDVGKGEEIRRPDEEVPMECVDAQTLTGMEIGFK